MKSGIAASVVIAILAVAAVAHAGVDHAYTETFDTILYRDAPATTADWNTALGELRLQPFSMSVVGSYPSSSSALDVYVYGNRAYIADFSSGLRIVDISDATNPALLGTYNAGSSVNTVRVTGDTALLGTNAGLSIINVTTPAAPVFRGALATASPVNAIDMSGYFACLAQGNNLMTVYLSDVSSPSMLDTLAMSSLANDVVVDGDIAYLLTNDALHAIDISVPTTLKLFGSLPLGSTTAHSLVLQGDIAYIAHSSLGLVAVDVSNPSLPQMVASLPLGVEPWGLDVRGDRAYVSDVSGFALHTVDVSDPAFPVPRETLALPGPSPAVDVEGDLAFVSSAGAGVQVVRTAKALPTPLVAGQVSTPNQARDVVIRGNVAIVVVFQLGLHLFDITDPSNPTFLSEYAPGSLDAVEVEAQGDYVFISDFSGGQLQVVNIADPTTPTFATEVAVSPTARALRVNGNFAFMGNDFTGPDVFSTIDISDPTTPTVIDTASVVGDPRSFAVVGVDPMTLYATTPSETYIYDVSATGTLTELGTMGFGAGELAIYGHYLLVARSEFKVFDISTPSAPVQVDTVQIVTGNVVTGGHLAIVRNAAGRLKPIDISDPTNIFALPTVPNLSVSFRRMRMDGDFVYAPAQNVPYSLYTTQIYQSAVDEVEGTAQSLVVSTSNDTIRKAFLDATYPDSVLWELSPDAGAHWEPVEAGAWYAFANAGVDLKWRSQHRYAPNGTNPAVPDLTLSWLFDSAAPDAVTDIPGDAGGWARLAFTRSAWDFAGETVPVTQYDVYRKIADAAAVSRITADGVAVDGDKLGSVEWNGRTFVTQVSATATAGGVFPPGTWEFVASIGALQQDTYLAAVPTLSDSTASNPPSELIVVTHTTNPALWFVSEIITGYSVDNIPPGAPTGFGVAYNMGGANVLSWDPAPEPDFQYYRIYRSPDPNFTPTPGDLVYQTTATLWGDTSPPAGPSFYRVTAVDDAGNESEPAVPGTATAAGENRPLATKLNGNYPNPFNPTTHITFSLDARRDVTLDVFDVSGRLVARLVSGTREGGLHSVAWDGTNASGQRVASGVYLCRLRAGDYAGVRRLVLLK